MADRTLSDYFLDGYRDRTAGRRSRTFYDDRDYFRRPSSLFQDPLVTGLLGTGLGYAIGSGWLLGGAPGAPGAAVTASAPAAAPAPIIVQAPAPAPSKIPWGWLLGGAAAAAGGVAAYKALK